MASSLIELLSSSTKLDRNKGVEILEQILNEPDGTTAEMCEKAVLDLLSKSDVPWETRHGALMGARAIVDHPTYQPYQASFEMTVKDHGIMRLEDAEYRVRLAAADLFGSLCKRRSLIYEEIKPTLFEGIRKNLEKEPIETATCQLILIGQKHCTSAIDIFNDTAKWKNLETWLKCLQCMVDGSGPRFNVFINEEILELLTLVLADWNRFVREECCLVVASIIRCNISDENVLLMSQEESAVYRYADVFSNLLFQGMSDECSQVRMAASVGAQKFLVSLPEGTTKQTSLNFLLPVLCFNRYYTAEGVRLYNQETWMLVTSGEGKHLFELNIDRMVRFYIEQLSANNHEIKETSCMCIREMVEKINSSILKQFILQLLVALEKCFVSEIWTVRDAAFVTCGKLISTFPDQCKKKTNSLYENFFNGLEDNAPPVREASAIALACLVKAIGNDALTVVTTKMKEGLEGVEYEKTDEQRREESGVSSSSSLAMQSELGSKATAELEKNKRPVELWEIADGCLCLMCELAQCPSSSNQVVKLLPLLAKAASFHHYGQHAFFLQSVCKQLPVLFRHLGKGALKLYIEQFFDLIFYCAASDIIPVSTAANECIAQLNEMLGPNILHARLKSYNPRYLQYLKKSF